MQESGLQKQGVESDIFGHNLGQVSQICAAFIFPPTCTKG